MRRLGLAATLAAVIVPRQRLDVRSARGDLEGSEA
jgi:hypothetical protein